MIYVWLLVLTAFLSALSAADIKTYRLPDALTFPLMALGVAQSYNLHLPVKDSLIGIAAGYLSLLAVELAYKALRNKDGLGRGDAKLLAAGGAWCGWMGLPYIVLIASLSGLAYTLFLSFKQKSSENLIIPFGPFLAFGIVLVWTAQRYVEGRF